MLRGAILTARCSTGRTARLVRTATECLIGRALAGRQVSEMAGSSSEVSADGVGARHLLDLPKGYHTAPRAQAWQGRRRRAWMLHPGCRAVGRCQVEEMALRLPWWVRSTTASRHQEGITTPGTDRHAPALRGTSTRQNSRRGHPQAPWNRIHTEVLALRYPDRGPPGSF